MIKIISIKKDTKRYLVTIECGNEISHYKISEDLLIEMRFLSPKEITESNYNLFLSRLPEDAILLEGIKYLDKRIHSEKEVKEHLLNITSSIPLIDKIIIKLKNKRLLNDEYYKDAIVSNMLNDRRDGKNLIIQKLKEKGLDTSFEYPKEVLRDNIKYLTIKFNEKENKEPRKSKIEKCKFFLLRKGYTEFDISEYFESSLITVLDEEKLKALEYQKLMTKYDNDIERVKIELLKKGFKE